MLTAQNVSLVVTTCTMVIAQMFLFTALSEFRYDRRKVNIATVLFTAVMLTVCIGTALRLGTVRDTGLSMLTLALPSLIYFFTVSRYRGMKFLVTYCISDLSIALVDLFAFMAVFWLSGGNHWADVVVRTACVLLWSLALRSLIGSRYRKALNLLPTGWGVIMLATAAMYVLMGVLSAYPSDIYKRPQDMPAAMLMVAVMELMVVVLVRVLYGMLNLKEQQLKEQALRSQLEFAKSQHMMMAERYEELRRIRHDMKYHMNVISGFVNAKNYDRLAAYLENYQNELTALHEQLPVFSKNETVNILAAHYDSCAKKENIRAEWDIRLPETLPMDDVHLTALLGNILQNAVEACGRLPGDAEKYIRCTICLKNKNLVVRVENSARMVKPGPDGGYRSEKNNDHGYGLASIEAIAALHGGYCSFGWADGAFRTEIVIPQIMAAEEKT